jgi:hypothetical protein
MRISATLGVILAVCVFSAGCGGTSLRTIARADAKKYLGNPNPQLLSIETVRLENGDQHVVVRMKGNFTLMLPSCGPFVARVHRNCHPSAHYAVIEFSASDPAGPAGFWNSYASEENAVSVARRDPRFRIFPDFGELLVRCAIPGSWGGSVSGTCSTRGGFLPRRDFGRVEFTEHWPLSRPGGTRFHTTWTVKVSRSGRILSVQHRGDLPPQLWASATQPPVPRESVTRARRELPYLAHFPRFPGTAPCVMQGGGVRLQTFHGTCMTRILAPKGNRPRLEFVEHWRLAHRGFTGGWIVTLRHDGRILSVGITGANPPQSWR